MSKLFKTEGVVLRRRDLGEADQIVTLLTPGFGKIHCIAKGCRKLTSKFCGRVELYYRLRVIGYWGRDFGYLKEVEVLDDAGFLDVDLVRHYALAVMTEATCKLVQDEQMVEGVYPLLCRTSRSLRILSNPRAHLQNYLKNLLDLLGFLPTTANEPKIFLKRLLNGNLKSEEFLWSG